MTSLKDGRRDQVALLIVAGPAGCGKSTVADTISQVFSLPFIEGDSLHSEENLAKMSGGVPLNDDDRWDWLDSVAEAAAHLEKTIPATPGIVITCSSLKRIYRERLRERIETERGKGSKLQLWFLWCGISKEESLRRVTGRSGHYMKADMVESQFGDLQIPDERIEERVTILDAGSDISAVREEVIKVVRCILH